MQKKVLGLKKAQISYLDNGQESSVSVVFVHGNSSRKEAFTKQFEAPELARYRLIALDLPGHGESESVAAAQTNIEIYGYPYYAEVLSEFIRELKLKKCICVGHSLGGHLAIAASSLYPLSGLVISQTPPLNTMADTLQAFTSTNPIGTLYNHEATQAEIEQVIALFAKTDELKNELRASWPLVDPYFRINFLACMQSGLAPKEIDQLESLTCPFLILEGDQDSGLKHSYFEDHPLLSKHLVTLSGALHFPHFENSVRYSLELARFLQQF